MKHLPLVALIAWAVLIFIASSIPNPPDAGGGDWKYEAAHVFEYAVLGALAFVVLRGYLAASLVFIAFAAWTLSVLYGMSDEFHQSFVPNRDASWMDVGFDAAGSVLGITATVIIRRLRRPATNRELLPDA